MLFDLRGRGRRRTIQGIYLGLAVLMGGGLVFFGVGGTGVGLFNNDNNNSSSGGGSGALAPLRRAEKAVRLHPRDANAWGQLALQRYTASRNDKKYFDVDNNGYTPAGLALLRSSETAWNRYVALHPRKPDSTVINTMAGSAFGSAGLNLPRKVVEAYELATIAAPHDYLPFLQLAQAAYAAKEPRKGALAGQRAIELSPKDQRANTQALIKQAATQAAKPPSSGATTTSPSG
ncbi:MAG: hypothetical protein QOK31_1138 [Solirubrobacteraceae bacterium]|jgi:hypothetical protein|nr:hypothetical protein [Solirubrobacteraceae bacterium]